VCKVPEAALTVDRSLDNEAIPAVCVDDGTVTIIAIVGFRNPPDIRACISALANSTEKKFVICVCENGGLASYQALVEALKDLVHFESITPGPADSRISDACFGKLKSAGPAIRIFCASKNLGYAGGVNLIVSQLDPAESWSALWVLNPDTEPDANALAALIERASTGLFDVIGSRLVSKSSRRVQAYGSRWRPLLARGLNIGRNASFEAMPDIGYIQRTMNYVSGASLFATREFIESVGLMDERYFLYCEEVDWCLRGNRRRLGYAHDSIVYHTYGTTIGSHTDHKKRSKLSVYLDHRNGLLLTRRFFPAIYPIVIATNFLFTLRYLMVGATDNFSIAMRGWLAGLRGEEGQPKQFDETIGLQGSEDVSASHRD
jgi:N-acetylglucosaminyl-diphospho-decaprenol L-rhamnosyltransferase